jgi:anti-anti-sigma factor
MAQALNYSLREYDGLNILDISGDLTSNTSDSFKSVVYNLTERDNLLINAENISFVTCGGINALLEVSYFARDKGNRVVIVSADNDLMEQVDYIEAYRHLLFASSVEEGHHKIELYT